jgi:outer membrane protein OmpA-like peptidoglycan-associated protein
VGTNPRAIQIAGLPAGTVLSVSPSRVASIAGLARIHISGSTVHLVADPDFSGIIRIPLTATYDDVRSTVLVTLVVSPNVAVHPRATPLTASRTRISWHRSRNAHRYQVVVGGRVVCVTRHQSCTVPQLLGPRQRVLIRALGGAGTRSARTAARPQVRHQVAMASVYFATASAHLTAADRRTLRRFAKVILSRGFRHLVLVGHTDSRGSQADNQRLSARRSRHTHAYLQRLLAGHGVRLRTSWRGERAPEGNNSTAVGRARNRRVDVNLY